MCLKLCALVSSIIEHVQQSLIAVKCPSSICFFYMFYFWGIDFIGPFAISFGFVYILLVVDYASKVLLWVNTHFKWLLPRFLANDSGVVVDFVRCNLLACLNTKRNY